LRVAAPPVDGRANEEIARFLAERLGVPRRALVMIGGAGGRRKLFGLDAALDAAVLAARLYQGLRP